MYYARLLDKKAVEKYVIDDNYLPKFDINQLSPCPTLFNSMYITAEGIVVPCCRGIEKKMMELGNVKVDKLSDIWNGKRFINARKRAIQNEMPYEFCIGCEDISHDFIEKSQMF